MRLELRIDWSRLRMSAGKEYEVVDFAYLDDHENLQEIVTLSSDDGRAQTNCVRRVWV